MKISKYQWIGSPKELSSLRISLGKSSSLCLGKWIAWLHHHCDGSRPPKQSRQVDLCLSFLYSITHPFTSFIPSLALCYHKQSQNISCLGQIMWPSFQKTKKGLRKEFYILSQFYSWPSSYVCYIWRKFSTFSTIIIPLFQILHHAWFPHNWTEFHSKNSPHTFALVPWNKKSLWPSCVSWCVPFWENLWSI